MVESQWTWGVTENVSLQRIAQEIPPSSWFGNLFCEVIPKYEVVGEIGGILSAHAPSTPHEGPRECGRERCSQQAEPGESAWRPETSLPPSVPRCSVRPSLSPDPAVPSSRMQSECQASEHSMSPPFKWRLLQLPFPTSLEHEGRWRWLVLIVIT